MHGPSAIDAAKSSGRRCFGQLTERKGSSAATSSVISSEGRHRRGWARSTHSTRPARGCSFARRTAAGGDGRRGGVPVDEGCRRPGGRCLTTAWCSGRKGTVRDSLGIELRRGRQLAGAGEEGVRGGVVAVFLRSGRGGRRGAACSGVPFIGRGEEEKKRWRLHFTEQKRQGARRVETAGCKMALMASDSA